MNRRRLLTALILLIGVWSGAIAMPAQAADPTRGEIRLAQSEVSLDEAVERVRRRYDGKVISASTRRDGNRAVHYIRVLSADGKVRTVRVDAQSGRMF